MTLAPLILGGVKIEFPVMLAPMAGYTDAALRTLCRRFGSGLAFTEVANAEAIARGMKRTLHLLETTPAEGPVAAHMYGADPDCLARAARVVESLGRFSLVDINCGCPVRKIVAKGAGAALTRDPGRIEAIVRAVRGAVSLPVTVKTRTGFAAGMENISEIAHAVEAGGGSAIFIHARVAARRHQGAADWTALARVKRERGIPVIGNGGVERAEDALRMARETGVDGVMIGRGAVGRPWIFSDIAALNAGRRVEPLSPARQREVIAEHLTLLTRLKEKEYKVRRRRTLSVEQAAVLHFRGHLYRYLAGRPGWPEERRRFDTLKTVEEVLAMVARVLPD